MFSKYFQSELSFLRELGKEFSSQHPGLADTLAERGSDPDVERLLEGFAFLSARILEKSEDAFPELIEPISEILFPQWIRPIPACSIVEFTPKPGVIRNRVCIDKGTPLGSIPVEGTSCQFRTTSDVNLLPISISDCIVRPIGSAQTEIELAFYIPEHAIETMSECNSIRLFVHGTNAFSSEVCFWFQKLLESIHLVDQERHHHKLSSLSVHLPMLRPEEPIFSIPEHASCSTQLLQENFSFSKKLFFIDLLGIQTLPFDQIGETLRLVFRFNHPPDLAEPIQKDTFRLFCTPVINLFEISADPISHSPIVNEYLLRPNGVDPKHAETHRVQSVTGLNRETKARTSYASFSDYSHVAPASPASKHSHQQNSPFYFIRRKTSELDGAHDTYLSVSLPEEAPDSASHRTPNNHLSQIEAQEILSVELECTNRLLPLKLRPGDISVPLPESPTVATFQNITAVSKPVHPPLGSELQWKYLGYLQLSKGQLASVHHLRSIFSLYNLQKDVDAPLGNANQQKISSLLNIGVEPDYLPVSMKIFRGVRSIIEIDESKLSSTGEIFFWGEAIQFFLQHQVQVNSFHALTLKLQPSNRTLYWEPNIGTSSLL